jgi:hypothetical protein
MREVCSSLLDMVGCGGLVLFRAVMDGRIPCFT